MGDFQHVLHLAGGIGEHIGIGVGRGTRHEAAVGEHVRRAPEQLGVRCDCISGKDVGDGAQVLDALLQAVALGGHVRIVEAEERDIEQVEELERHLGLELGAIHRAALIPGPVEAAAAKRVAAFPREGVPNRPLPGGYDLPSACRRRSRPCCSA